jgi:hypothetical protein
MRRIKSRLRLKFVDQQACDDFYNDLKEKLGKDISDRCVVVSRIAIEVPDIREVKPLIGKHSGKMKR